MDRELKDYLDRLEHRVNARFDENQAQMAEFRARFDESQEQMAEFRGDVERRFDRVDGEIRQAHVMIEDVRTLTQTVAEGVVAVREGQQRNTGELKEEIGEVRDLLTASYGHLDRRLTAVEGR